MNRNKEINKQHKQYNNGIKNNNSGQILQSHPYKQDLTHAL